MKLHEQRDHKENALKEAEEALRSLRKYLASDKFNCGHELDQYVNVKDVDYYVLTALNIIQDGRET